MAIDFAAWLRGTARNCHFGTGQTRQKRTGQPVATAFGNTRAAQRRRRTTGLLVPGVCTVAPHRRLRKHPSDVCGRPVCSSVSSALVLRVFPVRPSTFEIDSTTTLLHTADMTTTRKCRVVRWNRAPTPHSPEPGPHSSGTRRNPFTRQPPAVLTCREGPEDLPSLFRMVTVVLREPLTMERTFSLLDDGSALTLMDEHCACGCPVRCRTWTCTGLISMLPRSRHER